MEKISKIVLIILVFSLFFLGRWCSKYLNNSISQDSGFRLPSYLLFIFGRPGKSGMYNIRSIYIQLFMLIYMLPFILYNFDAISKQRAYQVFFAGAVLLFLIIEVTRHTLKK